MQVKKKKISDLEGPFQERKKEEEKKTGPIKFFFLSSAFGALSWGSKPWLHSDIGKSGTEVIHKFMSVHM